jgi:hypothetical protein
MEPGHSDGISAGLSTDERMSHRNVFEQSPTRVNAQRQTEQIVLLPLRGRSWKEISSDLTTRADRRKIWNMDNATEKAQRLFEPPPRLALARCIRACSRQ